MADQIRALAPAVRALLRAERRARTAAIRYCLRVGITHFADLGCGMPQSPALPDIIERAGAETYHCVLVDADMIADAHNNVWCRENTHPARVAAIEADLRDAEGTWSALIKTGMIRDGEPACLLTTGVLHHIEDENAVAAAISCYSEHLAPGSVVVLSHYTDEHLRDAATAESIRKVMLACDSPLVYRSSTTMRNWLAGLDLLGPGVAPAATWTAPGAPRPPFERRSSGAPLPELLQSALFAAASKPAPHAAE